MTALFDLHRGDGPVLYSVPHAGTECPDFLVTRLCDEALQLPDTDWFVDRLFGFVTGRGQSLLVAKNTRYLIDLNRPSSNDSLYPGQATTGLCPTEQFDGTAIYREGAAPDAAEVKKRIERYWLPYHQQIEAELSRLRKRHGYAVLFDCHSIASRVPRLFEGTLPVLNLGTNHGVTAARDLEGGVVDVLEASEFETAINGRFVGGAITRSYGAPAHNVHALQLEIGWDGYLAKAQPPRWDDGVAAPLMRVLERVAEVLENWRPAESAAAGRDA